MKIQLFVLALLGGCFTPLFAQKTKPSSQPYATTTTMNAAQQSKTKLFQFIRNSFPGSRLVPDTELKQKIDKAWEKGRHYGLSEDDDLGVYAIAAYALGENFDREIPQAAAVLQDTSYSSAEKTEWLYAFADDAVQEMRLPEGKAADEGSDEATRRANGSTADPTNPYQHVAGWAADRLRKGDVAAILRRFSPSVIEEVGLPRVEAVLRNKVVPVFKASLEVVDEVKVEKLEYPDGREGYALSSHLFALRRTKPYIGSKPFIILIVQENGQFFVADVDVDRESAHQHE